ncbi:MAG: competence/damage-inducible protein A [Peptoniphilaceae bacterium]
MKAAIITVGTEILIGSILNTNSKYLSNCLSEIGIHVAYHVSVRDNYLELQDEIEYLLDRVDILFLCGGLGPTKDDMTKEALAEALGLDLILDQSQYNKLINNFKKLKRTMTKNNIKQAVVIKGSKILENNWGTAPGEIIEYKNKKIILLPGPPKEFEPMVDLYLKNYLKNDNEIIIKSLNIAGLGESKVEDMIRSLNIEEDDISLNTFAHFYDTEIKIIAEGKNKIELSSKVNQKIEVLKNIFKGYLYAEDNKPINEVLIDLLKEKNKVISFAESVTGGLISSKITSVAGASNVFKNAIISYSNEAKNKILNVDLKTLNDFGAVSKETALEMAKGLKDLELCDIAVSITGEAGPVKSEKEIGTVFVCYYYSEDNYEIKEYHFNGTRNQIQERISNTIMSHLIFNLGGKNGE